jgi:DNA polymerase-3 subunit gamma/tau
LNQEGISFEEAALDNIARAANGSLRDALSLLDQAISYGEGSVSSVATMQMLGSVGQQEIVAIVAALASQDKQSLWNVINNLAETASDYAEILNAISRLLYQVALHQVLPKVESIEFAKEHIEKLAEALPADILQVLYQISLIGKRDLNLAPDPRTGFEMVMLRMLAFRPLQLLQADLSTMATPVQQRPITRPEVAKPEVNKPIAQPVETPVTQPRPSLVKTEDLSGKTWHEILAELHLTGMLKQLAYNCAMVSFVEDNLTLAIHEKHAAILNEKLKQKLAEAFEQAFGKKIKLSIQVEGQVAETPAETAKKQTEQKQQQVEQKIKNDPFVQFLQAEFDAIIEPGSIKPIE